MSYTKFTIGSKYSIGEALNIINYFNEINGQKRGFYNSIHSLDYTIEDLSNSFNFIIDCTYFCKEDKMIFQNEELIDHIKFLQTSFRIYWLDVEISKIPSELIENVKWGSEFTKKNDYNKIQLAELRFINWRNKAQWEFWANIFKANSLLGQYCISRVDLISQENENLKLHQKQQKHEFETEQEQIASVLKILKENKKKKRDIWLDFIYKISIIILALFALFYRPIQIIISIVSALLLIIFVFNKDFIAKNRTNKKILFLSIETILVILSLLNETCGIFFVAYNLPILLESFYETISKQKSKITKKSILVIKILTASIITFVIYNHKHN
jgi:hypothetical protein